MKLKLTVKLKLTAQHGIEVCKKLCRLVQLFLKCGSRMQWPRLIS